MTSALGFHLMDRLVYRSRALWPQPAASLDAILPVSMWNNAKLEITGALGFHAGQYIQLLEGRPAALDDLLRRLSADPRHDRLEVLLRAPVSARLTPEWSMARIDMACAVPETGDLLQKRDGLGLAALMASLAHTGATGLV